MSEETRPSHYSPGQLEGMFPWVERLTELDISPQTIDILEGWGVTSETIDRLKALMLNFRYDLVEEKIRRMQRLPLLVSVNDQGEEMVTIRHFFDIHGRMDGQCADISAQFLIMLHTTGILDDMNSDIARKLAIEKEQNPGQEIEPLTVVPGYCTGLAETHFCRAGQNHCFDTLLLKNSKKETVDWLVVDAAMQVVRNKGDSKYIFNESFVNPTALRDHRHSITMRMGTVTAVESDVVRFFLPDKSVIIGVSNNRKWAYGLSFARDKESGVIIPILTRIHADGDHHDTFHLDPNDPERLLHSYMEAADFTFSDYAEVIGMLSAAQQLTYEELGGDLPADTDLKHNTVFK